MSYTYTYFYSQCLGSQPCGSHAINEAAQP